MWGMWAGSDEEDLEALLVGAEDEDLEAILVMGRDGPRVGSEQFMSMLIALSSNLSRTSRTAYGMCMQARRMGLVLLVGLRRVECCKLVFPGEGKSCMS